MSIKTEHFPNGVPGGVSLRGVPLATWLATNEGAAGKQKPVGVGRSEAAAIADLLESLVDPAEAADACWTAIMTDPLLARARSKLSIHEIRLIVSHAKKGAA